MPPASRFRALCRLLRVATWVVSVGLALLYLFGAVGLPWIASGGSSPEAPMRALLVATFALPAVGYLWALWALQRTLADLSAGRLFHVTVARGLRHMGAGVLAGALANVFLVTNLARWITGGRGSYLYFDLSGIVLGVVGASLLLIAYVVDAARAAQDELDGIL
jgi:hypothetical protein